MPPEQPMISMSRLAELLNQHRSKKKEYEAFANDPWFITNSEIEPQKLHALGVITFRWTLSENKLLSLFQVILGCSVEDTYVLVHGVSNVGLITRVRLLVSNRIKDNDELVYFIENILDIYDVCRQNRNQLTHFGVVTIANEESGSRLALGRRSRAPEYRKVIPFPDGIKDLRRIARDIRRLNDRLTFISFWMHARNKGNPTTALPALAPVPKLLWKPISQV